MPSLFFSLLLLVSLGVLARANVLGTRRLYCMTCQAFPGDTTQLDQFRVRQRLSQPVCEMEPVECGLSQDACVTVSMKVGLQRYWVGAGCDKRVNYDYPAHRDGCAKMEVATRSFQPGYMEEGRSHQMVCLCTGNLCNSATTRFHLSTFPHSQLFILLTALVVALRFGIG